MSATAIGESVDHAIEGAKEKGAELVASHPRARAFLRHAKPFAKASLYGVAVAGGAILLAKILGPSTARQLGRNGGEGFAEGVNAVQRQIAAVTRGSRWG